MKQSFFYWNGDWTYGLWCLRFGAIAYQLKAPWCAALFSERNHMGVKVYPLWKGWRFLIRGNCR